MAYCLVYIQCKINLKHQKYLPCDLFGGWGGTDKNVEKSSRASNFIQDKKLQKMCQKLHWPKCLASISRTCLVIAWCSTTVPTMARGVSNDLPSTAFLCLANGRLVTTAKLIFCLASNNFPFMDSLATDDLPCLGQANFAGRELNLQSR